MFDLYAELDKNAERICELPEGYTEHAEGRDVQDELLEAIDKRMVLLRELRRKL